MGDGLFTKETNTEENNQLGVLFTTMKKAISSLNDLGQATLLLLPRLPMKPKWIQRMKEILAVS